MEQVRFETRNSGKCLPGMPVECFEMNKSRPGVFASSHWHNAAELILVRKGEFRVIAGNDVKMIQEGEGVLIRPCQLHTTICPDIPDVALTVLKFEPDFLRGEELLPGEAALLRKFSDLSGSAIWMGKMEKDRLIQIADEIQEEISSAETGWQMAVRAKIWMLLLIMMRNAEKGEVAADKKITQTLPDFFPVFEYLEKNFAGKVEISELLDICHLSYSRFSVRFKELTGLSLTEYRNRMRIDHAKQMLLSGNVLVSEAASACGFYDLCYFDRLFRRYTSHTPSFFVRKLSDVQKFIDCSDI